MKRFLFLFYVALMGCIHTTHAQWVVTDPTNLAQGIINTTKQIIETSSTAGNTLNSFKEAVKIYEQSKQYYDALKSVNNLVRDARKVQKTVLMIGEINEIYIDSYSRMLNDDSFTSGELAAISDGYTKILEESTDALTDLSMIISPTTLSLTDKDRMDMINRTYDEVEDLKGLMLYFTKKTIAVSYIRAQQKNENERVTNLYSAGSKYW